MRCGSLFSGIGLLDFGLTLAGFEHEWLCEADEWRRGILAKRFPGAEVHADVRDAHAGWGGVGLVAGGFPCKGASTIGKREGFGHPETVLWRPMARAIGELRPRYVLVENVANILLLHDGSIWGEVLGALAALGYDTVWDCLPAAAVGAPHRRDRVFAVATHATDLGPERAGGTWNGRPGLADGGLAAAHASRDAEGGAGPATGSDGERARAGDYVTGVAVEWGEYEPAIRRWEAVVGCAPEPLVRGVDDRGAARVVRSRLSALGDGVQVQVGYLAGMYIQRLERERTMTEGAA